jgi:hypothetical protein
MNVSATLSPHQVEAVKLTVGVYGKRVARLEFLTLGCSIIDDIQGRIRHGTWGSCGGPLV